CRRCAHPPGSPAKAKEQERSFQYTDLSPPPPEDILLHRLPLRWAHTDSSRDRPFPEPSTLWDNFRAAPPEWDRAVGTPQGEAALPKQPHGKSACDSPSPSSASDLGLLHIRNASPDRRSSVRSSSDKPAAPHRE